MKKFNRQFLLIASLTLLYSCGQSVSHYNEVNYYVTIATEMKNTSSKVNDFWHQLIEAIEIAQQNENRKLDESYIDTLNKSYQLTTLALSSSIDKISAIKEIDVNINLKGKTLEHLTETKELQESALPQVIKALSIGLDKITNEQRESFDKFETQSNTLQNNSNGLEKVAREFLDKHNITNEELKKSGL